MGWQDEYDAAIEEPLRDKIERLATPIGMQDVRLVTGEGKLTATDVLSAVNVILKSRARS